jgi:hypothetical protein
MLQQVRTAFVYQFIGIWVICFHFIAFIADRLAAGSIEQVYNTKNNYRDLVIHNNLVTEIWPVQLKLRIKQMSCSFIAYSV